MKWYMVNIIFFGTFYAWQESEARVAWKALSVNNTVQMLRNKSDNYLIQEYQMAVDQLRGTQYDFRSDKCLPYAYKWIIFKDQSKKQESIMNFRDAVMAVWQEVKHHQMMSSQEEKIPLYSE